MARFHTIDTDIWEELLELTTPQKLLYIYLFSNPLCRPSGLYRIRWQTIAHHTKTMPDDFQQLCGSLIEYDADTMEVWIRGAVKRILRGLAKNIRMQRAILFDLEGLQSPLLRASFLEKYKDVMKTFKGACKGLARVPLPLPLPVKNEKGGAGGKTDEGLPPSFLKAARDAYPQIPEAMLLLEWRKMQEYWRAKAKPLKRPFAAWLNWLKKQQEFTRCDQRRLVEQPTRDCSNIPPASAPPPPEWLALVHSTAAKIGRA